MGSLPDNSDVGAGSLRQPDTKVKVRIKDKNKPIMDNRFIKPPFY
jgi:hypothetical protein